MNNSKVMRWITAVILFLALIFLPDLIAGNIQLTNLLTRTAVICLTLLIIYTIEATPHHKPALLILIITFGISMAAYVLFEFEQLAWVIVVFWFTLLILLQRQLSCVLFKHKIWYGLWQLFVWSIAALIAGVGLSVFDAILSLFSEEEFFIAVSGISLSLFWLILALIYQLIGTSPPSFFSKLTQPQWVVPTSILSLFFITILAFPWLLKQYQRSFFPLAAPSYQGISEESPFICEQLNATSQIIPQTQIENDLVQLLENAPNKNTLTWGNLALYNHDKDAAIEFRASLLQEAAQNLYTEPAHSVKWGQYQAAQRVHQFVLIEQAFPNLFSEEDKQTLSQWFVAINKRALTTEWVDWLYAAAYGVWPQGPYENQEIGSGLLAALTHYGFAGDLTAQNESYLATRPVGWEQIFRNTDDSYSYQSVWLANAWWINQYRHPEGDYDFATQQNIEKSLAWLLLLSLPDGETLSYNIAGEPTQALTYVVAAALSNNPELSWLAGHTMQQLRAQNKHLSGYFAVDPFALTDGQSPSTGSCLMFGDSGVPTQKGPLAPDKVVFRDGWYENAAYALLNLRFSGWHRYKATNTIPLIYQAGPLVTERWAAENFWWLPDGRSAFRDKRVPREFLNGLIIPKSGLSEVLWQLTAVGTAWAQDPPAYAETESYFTSDFIDMSTTSMQDWHGWQHKRTVYLIHDGLILVMDDAYSDQAPQPASLIWHLDGEGEIIGNKMNLANEQRNASMVWSETDTPFISRQAIPATETYLRSPEWELLYTSESKDNLTTSFAFLTQEYTQGDFDLAYIGEKKDGILASWSNADNKTQLLHNFGGNPLEFQGLGTDGFMLSQITHESETHYCFVGGQTIRIQVDNPKKITTIHLEDSIFDPSFWQQQDEWITISLPAESEFGCFYIDS